MERRSRLFTFILALIPGAGQMYLGQMNKGIELLALFFLIDPVFSFVGLGFIGGIARLLLWCYAFFDTFDLARRVDRGERIREDDFVLFRTLNDYVKRTNTGSDNEDFPPKEENMPASDRADGQGSNWLLWGWGLVIIGMVAILNRTFWNNEFYGLVKSFVSMYFIPIVMIAAGGYLLIKNKNRL